MSYVCNGYTACPSCGIGCNYECSSSTTEWGVCEEVPRGALVGGGRPSLGGGRGRAHVIPTSSPNPNWRRGGGGYPRPIPTYPTPQTHLILSDDCDTCGVCHPNRCHKCSGKGYKCDEGGNSFVAKGRGYPRPIPTYPTPRPFGRKVRRGGFGRGLSQSNIRAKYGRPFRG